jgi:hypothetical protein
MTTGCGFYGMLKIPKEILVSKIHGHFSQSFFCFVMRGFASGYILEDKSELHTRRHENLKSHIIPYKVCERSIIPIILDTVRCLWYPIFQGSSNFSAGVPPYVMYHVQCISNNYFMYLNEKQQVLYVTAFIERCFICILWFYLTMLVYQWTVADVPLWWIRSYIDQTDPHMDIYTQDVLQHNVFFAN